MARYDQMVADIICDTFRKEVGTWGGNPPGKSHGEPQKAMQVSFSTILDYDTESGYRSFDLLIFAGANYVGVYFRRRWNISLVGSQSYTKGVSGWGCLGYHDSCWPSCVENFLREQANIIIGLSCYCSWFEVITLDDETIRDLFQSRRK